MKETLKRILLSSNLNLLNDAISNADAQIIRAFNAAVSFISENEIYKTTICKCVKVESMLRYKVDHIQSRLNELIIMIMKLKRIHEEEESVVCLIHWKKLMFLLNTVLKLLKLIALNDAIVDRNLWTSFAVQQKHKQLFHDETIKNYIGVINERMINVFVEFLKKIKQTNLNNFEINIYWNAALKSSTSSLSFVVFNSFEQLQIDFLLQYARSRQRLFSRSLA